MDNFDSNVETNSVVDFVLEARGDDPMDSDADLLRAGNSDNGVDPNWAESTEAMAVGPGLTRTRVRPMPQQMATPSNALSRTEDPQPSCLTRLV